MLLKLLILVVACSIITWSPTWSKEPCFPLDQYNWLFCPNQLEDGKGIRSLLSNLSFQLQSHFNLFVGTSRFSMSSGLYGANSLHL